MGAGSNLIDRRAYKPTWGGGPAMLGLRHITNDFTLSETVWFVKEIFVNYSRGIMLCGFQTG